MHEFDDDGLPVIQQQEDARERVETPTPLGPLAAQVRTVVERVVEKRGGLPKDATELFRSWGAEGGKARSASLSPERRAEIARQAARKRWGR